MIMKLIKQASGKTTVKMSKKEWTDMGKKAGWLGKEAYDPYAGQITEPNQIPSNQNGLGQDPVEKEVEAWVMQTGKPGVIDKWHQYFPLAYRAYKGDQAAWNELLMKCGDQAMGTQGQPAGNAPMPSGTRPGTTNPY
jgi:hypothetical protein